MQNCIEIKWCVQDIQSVYPELTDEQARKVLQKLKRRHDATVGINWTVIKTTIDMMNL